VPHLGTGVPYGSGHKVFVARMGYHDPQPARSSGVKRLSAAGVPSESGPPTSGLCSLG